MRYLEALRFLHRTYRDYPLPHRAHVFVRFLTCPFLRTLDVLPASGRVVEIGAGHGIYSYFAARDAARRVFAVEPDLRKSIHPEHAPGVHWIAGYDESVRGTWDAVVIYDATYRMPIDYRTGVYRRAFERLGEGGTFVLKDMDPDHPWKMAWARAQEWLSDRFLKISIGSGFIYQTRAEVAETLRAIGFEDVQARAIDRGYPHPHIIYTARKPRIMPLSE